MFFRQVRLEGMGCASYLIGSGGACAVVDPRWDIDAYLRLAQREGLTITHIIETHVHADHVSGHQRLATRTGAPVYVHNAARAGFAHQALSDGDRLRIGDVTLEVLHTPGHSPDSICLLVRDPDDADPPKLLTGDTLFVGDVGRPDLHGAGGAAQLYDSLARLLALDAATEVYPGHLAGSLCGRAISTAHHTTLGAERLGNEALRPRTREEFVEYLMGDLPARPPNFEEIIQTNRQGPPSAAPAPCPLTVTEFRRQLTAGAYAIDIREPRDFATGHVPDSLSVPLYSAQFGGYAGWFVPPRARLLLLAADDADVAEAVSGLAVVGHFGVTGYLDGGVAAWGEAGLPLARLEALDLAGLTALARAPEPTATLLDVREPGEWESGHIPGARNIPFRQIARRYGELPTDRPVAVVCANGNRSSVAASLLEQHGFTVLSAYQGMDDWLAAGYATARAGAARVVS